jgi:uncharacterized DUF497 family protein
MQFEWDDRKAAANLAKHGVDFASIERFEILTALVEIDDRKDYGETRFAALGLLGEDIVVVIYTEREEHTVRVISMRPANRKEVRIYVEEA